jgi:hypothetical protein
MAERSPYKYKLWGWNAFSRGLLFSSSPNAAGSSEKLAASMVKSFAAFAIFAVLGASVIALPGFAPKVEASESYVLAKADRLQVRSATNGCSKQVWPDISHSCLKSRDFGMKILEARLVPARR